MSPLPPARPSLVDLIGSFYDLAAGMADAEAETAAWQGLVAWLSEALGAHMGVLQIAHPERGQTDLLGALNVGAQTENDYKAHYFRDDLYLHKAQEAVRRGTRPMFGVHFSQDYVPAEELEKSRFYNEFLRPACDGAFFNAASAVPLPGGELGILSFGRQRARGAFGPTQAALLAALTPHLALSLVLRQRLRGARREGFLGQELLHSLSQPLLLADAEGRIAFLNRAAQQLIEAGGWARLAPEGRLAMRRAADAKRFARLIAAATDLNRLGGELAMRITPEEGAPVEILVAPFAPGRRQWREGEAPLALVMFSEPEPSPSLLARRAAESFGLSPAEAALAADLSLGHSPEEIAERRAVRITTVRTQIRAIMTKTGTRRQIELVRLLMRLPRRF